MASLTEESLSKLSKQELIAMMLKMQNKMESSDTKFAEEVRKLNESIQQLESALAISKNVNSQLHKRFEIKSWGLPNLTSKGRPWEVDLGRRQDVLRTSPRRS